MTFHGQPFMRCVPEGRYQELEQSWQIVSGLRGLISLLAQEHETAFRDLDAALGRLGIGLPPEDTGSVAA